jgi:hypothetical protein
MAGPPREAHELRVQRLAVEAIDSALASLIYR